MRIVNPKDTKPMKDFIRRLYAGDPCFKDTKTDLLDIVCNCKSSFYSRSVQQRIQVVEGERVLCQSVLICHKEQKNTLMVGFFEALPKAEEAVKMLFDRARAWGRLLGCTKMVVGLEGHCNNSLGFSFGRKKSPSFGEVYHPAYYQGYFKQMNPQKLVSFTGSMEGAKKQLEKDFLRLAKNGEGLVFEAADFKLGFRKTMRRYTALNNRLFSGHDHYFCRSEDEDAHLFGSMVPLLRGDNLLFVKKEGKDIGFLLWYPDFNELVPPGRGADWQTVLKFALRGKEIKTLKVVEIGVDKTLAPPGLILFLFHQGLLRATGRYKKMDRIISSWILEENTPSKNISRRYLQEPYKEYTVYEEKI